MIKLLINRHPPVLVSVVSGVCIVEYFHSMPAENSFINHDDIGRLLVDCCRTFRQLHFPRLIELCGTTDALEALEAAHSENDLSLLLPQAVEQGARAHQAAAYPGCSR